MNFYRVCLFCYCTMMATCVVSRGNAQQAGIPFVGRNDPAEYRNVDMGGGNISLMTLLDSKIMKTNIHYIQRGIIPPKCGIGEHIHTKMEEMYFIFNAPAEFTVDGRTALLPANSCVLCPLGSSHALYNNSEESLEWLSIAVTKEKGNGDEDILYGEVPGRNIDDSGAINMNTPKRGNVVLESPAPFRWAQFDPSLLKFVGPAHKGKGKILNRRPWLDGNFETNWVRIGHCILPPGTSIGYHQHNGIEEVYYVMSGHGRMTVNDHTWEIRHGDAVPSTLHDSHGLYNNTNKDLEIFVLNVSMVRDVLDAVDHGDDLTRR